ncbi:hypothetical protein SeMB42_g00959 [Synchytrium endobioticum]|uniref:Signal recognition particle subunit SRP14 n=1 Tax=Synchytrium endobioticum TaxID=286115 RepID=A0A507DCE9_9FUNG|nr:hypothetical protein SeLEV6574_g01743 [Synchytrium endobioticum]TPX53179.1 hypothetical protein SeMB42_g00959 [Synchytrium endobioticum]
MKRLSNDAFLTQLGKLFEGTKANGTVWITFKRLTWKTKAERIAETETSSEGQLAGATTETDDNKEYSCMVRATNGKTKLATVIQPADVEKFHDELTNLCRVHMDALKKRERIKKPKKKKAKCTLEEPRASTAAAVSATASE